ncbi:MAG: hypothetical protein JNL18_18150 [Planctomycetaceae bacterium]|nr:hypothetical protein [Planctomycetaceae bacterium]
MSDTVTLFRPVGQQELDLIRDAKWRAFPPRLVGQPIFYPVITEDYAIRIAREWNTKDPNSGFVGYVLQFEVNAEFLRQYDVQEAGGRDLLEYWIPAEELAIFNANIVGPIRVLHEFRPSGEKAS